MKNIKNLFILSILIFSSCNTIKIREHESDLIPEMRGKVKSMNIITMSLPTFENPAGTLTISCKFYFDHNNKITKQIDSSKNFLHKTEFNYSKNGLLENTVGKMSNSLETLRVVNKYDKNNNIISIHQYANDKLYFYKTIEYDKNNYKIEEQYCEVNKGDLSALEKYEYNFKERSFTVKNIAPKRAVKNIYLKFFYDKKGYKTKLEWYRDNLLESTTNYEYDKKGNSVKNSSYNENDKHIKLTIYKNKFDKKGNLISKETYYEDRLIEKSTYDIVYW